RNHEEVFLEIALSGVFTLATGLQMDTSDAVGRSQHSFRKKAMSYSAKFLPPGGTLVVCCLLLSGALASAQNGKTTVRYTTGHAVSRSFRDLPIDVFGLR